MDEATYSLIGRAYKEVEAKEEWCTSASYVADIAVLSTEAIGMEDTGIKTCKSDAGVARMLLEGKYLFNVVDCKEDFGRYKVLILPDHIRIDDILREKIHAFLKDGGKILATGESGLGVNGEEFQFDMGVQFIKRNTYNPDYFKPCFKLKNFENTSFVFYSEGQKIMLNGGKELGKREDPYFNREGSYFCSHQHTPNSGRYGGPGMVESSSGIYIAWNVFEDYAVKGSLVLKEIVIYALDRLLGADKTLNTDLPAQGVVTLNKQNEQKRYINHLLYASPVKRGDDIEVIEDIIPLYNIAIVLNLPIKAKRIYLAPSCVDIAFKQEGSCIEYIVPKVECHQMVVIEY
jgi:hypothetical protein